MKILFITAFPPCQKTAGQDYTRRLLQDLKKKGHEVSLIYSIYDGHQPELDEKIDIVGTQIPSMKNCILKFCYHPFFTKRFDMKTLNLIQSIKDNYDMLYFDFSQVHIYSKYVRHKNKVLMCHDVISQKFSRNGSWQLPYIRQTERKLLQQATKIITFSQKDCEYIKKVYGMDSFSVNFYLKNGNYKYILDSLESNKFCFYGAWNRDENIDCLEWFLSNVYDKIKSDIEFVIIGGGMSQEYQDKLYSYERVKYLGFVDDPIVEISKCQALIAPLRKGAGVKVKVIDALSSGTPVLGSDVAFEGIQDNGKYKLFKRLKTAEDYYKTINNWINIDVIEKQNAADEFFARYNVNHFTDLL